MKRLSPKTRARQAEAKPVRDALKRSAGRCEFCLKPRLPDLLACHEISNGTHRQKSLDKPYAILVVCLEPWGQPPCHATVQEWSEARQLALLYLVRSTDYDLAAYNRLVNERAPNRITQSEVDVEIQHLLSTRRLTLAEQMMGREG